MGQHLGGVVAEWVHLDERSPAPPSLCFTHEGRLNARHFQVRQEAGSAFQDEFALCSRLALVRGVRGRCPHLPVSAWWSALDRPPEPVKRSDYSWWKSMGVALRPKLLTS